MGIGAIPRTQTSKRDPDRLGDRKKKNFKNKTGNG